MEMEGNGNSDGNGYKNVNGEKSTSGNKEHYHHHHGSETRATSFPGLSSSQPPPSNNSTEAWPWRATYSSFVASLSFLCTGLLRAYTSPALLSIQQQDHGTILMEAKEYSMSRKELISWIASTPPLASFLGTILSGPLLYNLGRQKTLFLLTIPATIGWLLVGNAESIPVLLTGRALTGLASGLATASAPLYISEMCMSTSTSMTTKVTCGSRRNWLGLLPGLMLSTGILAGFILAHMYSVNVSITSGPSWRRLAMVISIFPMILLILSWTIPESSIWVQESKSFNGKEKHQKFDLEMDEVVPKTRKTAKETTGLIPRPTDSVKQVSRHLILVGVLMILQQFSGGNVLIYYLSEILTKGNSSGGSGGGAVPGTVPRNNENNEKVIHEASLVIGLIQFVGFFLSIPLIDHPRIGRRTLLITSSLLMSLSHLLLGFHFHHGNYPMMMMSGNSNFDILVRLILLSCISASYSIGLGPIPFQFIEIFPGTTSSLELERRATSYSYISSFASLVNHLALFGVVKGFPYMFHMDTDDHLRRRNNDTLMSLKENCYYDHGPDVTFWVFSAVCLGAALFSLVFVPSPEGSAKQEESNDGSNKRSSK